MIVFRPILEGHLPLKIRLKGLSYMNDDPSQIDVLYGLVQEEGNSKGVIQQLADAIVEYFYKAGDKMFLNDRTCLAKIRLGTEIFQLIFFSILTGFMNREFGRDNVKLHVTLINSKYRTHSDSATADSSASSARNSRRRRETFDGTEVLKKFADYDFGEAELKDIHLSQRHTVGLDGYYQPTCVITCN